MEVSEQTGLEGLPFDSLDEKNSRTRAMDQQYCPPKEENLTFHNGIPLYDPTLSFQNNLETPELHNMFTFTRHGSIYSSEMPLVTDQSSGSLLGTLNFSSPGAAATQSYDGQFTRGKVPNEPLDSKSDHAIHSGFPPLDVTFNNSYLESNFDGAEINQNERKDQNFISQPAFPSKQSLSQSTSPKFGSKFKENHTENTGSAPILDLQLSHVKAFSNFDQVLEVLVNFLRKYLHQIRLDEFYNLLYHSVSPQDLTNLPDFGTKNELPKESNSEAIRLCNLILENLRLSTTTQKSSEKIPVSSLNVHEALRMGLAIKIVYDAVDVEDAAISKCFISRVSVYKAYYVMCKQLMKKYPGSSKLCELQRSITLTHSQFGKVMKMAFPNLTANRLGKRGSSTYHYKGLKWNDSIIDEEIKRLVNLSLPDLELHFKRKLQAVNTPTKINYPPSVTSREKSCISDPDIRGIISLKLASKKPLYSFVSFASTMLGSECSFRSWESTPGEVPKRSHWANSTIQASVEALKQHNIEVDSLLREAEAVNFLSKQDSGFFEEVILLLRVLFNLGVPQHLYMHLYLIVSLFIFPAILASDKEIPPVEKVRLRDSLGIFVMRLEYEFVGLQLDDFCSLMSFSKIMKEMKNLSTFLEVRVKTSLVKNIIKVMTGDLGNQVNAQSEVHLYVSQIVILAVTMGFNALDWNFVGANLELGLSNETSIMNTTNSFVKYCSGLTEPSLAIPLSMTEEEQHYPTYDLPFQIFKVLARLFHESCLSEPSVSKLPIQLISFIMLYITNELQKLSFDDFAKRDHELSKETFKAWWVHMTIVQEYMAVFSEITALEAQLSTVS